jgi:hypothetical protein
MLATIKEAVFSVGASLRSYNEDVTQLELELSRVPELAVGRIIEKKWQERNQSVRTRLHSVAVRLLHIRCQDTTSKD